MVARVNDSEAFKVLASLIDRANDYSKPDLVRLTYGQIAYNFKRYHQTEDDGRAMSFLQLCINTNDCKISYPTTLSDIFRRSGIKFN